MPHRSWPVPAVIGTDYDALSRMAARKTGLPVFSVACNGMELYDRGEEAAYLSMFRALSEDGNDVEEGRIGVIGGATLELGDLSEAELIRNQLHSQGWQTVSMYGMGASFAEVKTAGQAKMNMVIAPAGLKAAEYLNQRFGTPYSICYPLEDPGLSSLDLTGRRALVVHQQVRANQIRQQLRNAGAAEVCVASWFMMKSPLTEPGDVHLTEEDDFIELAGRYDLIVADDTLRPMLGDYHGEWISAPHFAVSGKLVVV